MTTNTPKPIRIKDHAECTHCHTRGQMSMGYGPIDRLVDFICSACGYQIVDELVPIPSSEAL